MNSLLKMYVVENYDSQVETIEEVDPSQLPEIEAGFNEAVEVDTDVETHAVNLESLEDVISDVKDVVEQQKINLAEMKDDADISDGQNDSGNSEQQGEVSSNGDEGGSSLEGDDVTGDSSSESSSEGADGDIGSEGGDVSSDSSDASGDSSSDVVGDNGGAGEESSDSGDGSDSSSDSGESSGETTPSEEDQDTGDNTEESKDSGNSGESSSDENNSGSGGSDADDSEETPEPELDKDSSEEDIDKQIAQESLLLANCSGRVGVIMSIKNPSLENFYSQLGLSQKTCNLESNMDRKTRNYVKYKTHHESFLDVLDRFAVAAKEGIVMLIEKIIQLYQSIVSNFKKIFDTTKNEIKLVKNMVSSGIIDTPNKGKVPLKDIKVVIDQDSNIDINILLGVNYPKLMENEEILIENIIKAVTDFRQPGYIPNDQWAQHIIKSLFNAGLSDIGYSNVENKPVYFMGNGFGYSLRISKYGPYVLDTVEPYLSNNVISGDKLMECIEFSLETLPIINNPHHKSLIEEGLQFLQMLVKDTNHLYGSKELIMLLRGIQARQLSIIKAARQLRALLVETAKN